MHSYQSQTTVDQPAVIHRHWVRSSVALTVNRTPPPTAGPRTARCQRRTRRLVDAPTHASHRLPARQDPGSETG
jgi:hypothetical protein